VGDPVGQRRQQGAHSSASPQRCHRHPLGLSASASQFGRSGKPGRPLSLLNPERRRAVS
jgi:hypothetical protein